MIRWLNTGEHAQFFVSNDAEIGEYDENLGFVPDENGETNQPQAYESLEWSPYENHQNLVTINFSPVEEETEDQLLESDDWWETGQIDDRTGENGSGNTTDENGSDTNTTADMS